MTNPLLPSAAAAMEAAAKADALAVKAKEEYKLIHKLKNIWDGVTLLLEDPEFAAFCRVDPQPMPDDFKKLVFTFNALHTRFKEIQLSGVSQTLDILYREMKVSPLIEEEKIAEGSLEEMTMQVESISAGFQEAGKEISDELRAVGDSLIEFGNRFRDFQIVARNELSKPDTADPHIVVKTCSMLLNRAWSPQNRIYALNVMQHMVSCRWEELTVFARIDVLRAVSELIYEIAGPLKEPILALLLEILRRAGLFVWTSVLPQLMITSDKGPAEAVIVCSILQWFPTKYGTIPPGQLNAIETPPGQLNATETFPLLLTALTCLLNKHFTAYEFRMDSMLQQHEDVVHAVVKTIKAFSVWVSIEVLMKYQVLQGLSMLTSSAEVTKFKEETIELFGVLSMRSRPVDAAPEFDLAMSLITEQLRRASQRHP